MNLTEYKQIIKETAIYPQEVKNFGIAYCVLGLFDEIGEVMEKVEQNADIAEINKERFDVMWYICALCNELNLNFEGIVARGRSARHYSDEIEPSILFGMVKKYYRDGKIIDNSIVSNLLTDLVFELFKTVDVETFNKGLQDNYDKLMKRRATNTIHGDGDNRENETTN